VRLYLLIMRIRKTFILVKIPTSVPERIEPSIKNSFLIESKREKHQSAISLGKKIEQSKSKFWVKEFPSSQSLATERRVHGRSHSVAKYSPSPNKFRKYVESVLDKNIIKNHKSYKRNYSNLSYVKGVINSPPRNIYIRSKLAPMFKNRSRF